MVKKKSRSGLLKAPKTITGKHGVPKSLKPQRAREIIRRFHVLQKSKGSVLAKLQKIIPQISKNDYHQIEEMSIYQDSFKGFVLPLKYSENQSTK